MVGATEKEGHRSGAVRLRELSLWGLLILVDLTRHLCIFWQGPASIALDAAEYWQMAKHVVEGDWLLYDMPIAYRTPGYAWWLAPFRGLLGENALFFTVAGQHVLVGCTTVATAYLCFRFHGNRWHGLLGYLLSIGCLTRCWYANVLLSESLFCLLLTLFAIACLKYARSPHRAGAFLVAFLLGLSILARPMPQLLILPVGVILWIVLVRSRPKRLWPETIIHQSLYWIVIGLLLVPWYLRNQELFGKWTLTQLPAVNVWEVCFQDGAGANLPLPRTSTAALLQTQLEKVHHPPEDRYCYAIESSLKRSGMESREIDALIAKLGWEAIQEHPIRFAWSGFRRFVNFWRCVTNAFPPFGSDASTMDGQTYWRSPLAVAWMEPLLANTFSRHLRWNEWISGLSWLGFVWMVLKSQDRLFSLCLVLMCLYFALITAAAEIENYRYRMILEPFLILSIVCGAGEMVRRLVLTRQSPDRTPKG